MGKKGEMIVRVQKCEDVSRWFDNLGYGPWKP
jgi:hypothetical protein